MESFAAIITISLLCMIAIVNAGSEEGPVHKSGRCCDHPSAKCSSEVHETVKEAQSKKFEQLAYQRSRTSQQCIDGACAKVTITKNCALRYDPESCDDDEQKIVYPSDANCKWSSDHDGWGADEIELDGTYSQCECAAECKRRAKEDKQAYNINGATFSPQSKICWCEIGMNEKVPNETYDTCLFDKKDTKNENRGSMEQYINDLLKEW